MHGRAPDGRLIPLRVDADGRLEFVEVASGDQSKPAQSISSLPTITANPTRPTLLAQVLLGGTSTTIYTAAAGWRDLSLFLINVDTVARTAQCSLGALDNTHSLCKGFPLAVGDRGIIYIPGLASGDTIRGLCDSANGVAAELWGTAAS